MAYTFPDSGIIVVPTGSLGVAFKTSDGTLPSVIEIRATSSTDVVTNFSDLTLISPPAEPWQYVELTGVLPFGDVYDVEVIFDSVVVHTQSVEVPLPGKKRARVLRQRIYETVLAGALAETIDTVPFGSGYMPSSVPEGFKSQGGNILEIGVAYVTELQTGKPGYDSQTAAVTVPLNLYGAIDENADSEGVSDAFEEVAGYIMAANWRLQGFGVIQSAASYSGAAPEITEDRSTAVIRGSLTVAIMSKI